jgi:hypothetical protein
MNLVPVIRERREFWVLALPVSIPSAKHFRIQGSQCPVTVTKQVLTQMEEISCLMPEIFYDILLFR